MMAAQTFATILGARHGITIQPGQILKADTSRRLVFGIALESDVTDSQGDTVSPDDLTDAAVGAILDHKAVAGVQHRATQGVGRLAGSFPLTSDIAEALGITMPPGVTGLWLIALKIDDDATWADVLAGKFTGLSIGGTGQRKDFSS